MDYDAVPSHFIGHRDYMCDTKKTGDYMEGAKSLIILGVQVWDSLFDMVIKVGDHHEYPDEWRGRYYARRMTRHLDGLGYRTELEPELVPTDPFTEDLCGECDECVKACPVGALTPHKVDPDRCLLGMRWEDRLSEEFRDVYMEHSPSLTESTWLMCNTCQKACPIGRDLRFEKRDRVLAQ